MMRLKRRFKIEKGRFDFTPLANIVFLLIIFFMLSSSLIVQPSIKVDLPELDLDETVKEEDYCVIIQSDEKIFFNEYEITSYLLKDRLRTIARNNPEKVLIIKADKDTRHGRVIEVIAIAKDAGVSHIAFATKPGITQAEKN